MVLHMSVKRRGKAEHVTAGFHAWWTGFEIPPERTFLIEIQRQAVVGAGEDGEASAGHTFEKSERKHPSKSSSFHAALHCCRRP